jgi:hypothetical protein
MDANNNLLVQRLIGAAAAGDDLQASFRAALHRMGLTSVFDITRMTRAKFALELGKHTQANADQVYDNAQSHARRVSRLYLERLVSPKDASARHRRDLPSKAKSEPASYQALFKENWDKFCKEGDLAAIDSPVAYLRALYLFAGQLEGASSSREKIPLDERRPDLKDLMLDQQSAFVARPMLEIVNRTLDKAIKTHFEGEVHQHLATEHYPFSLPYDLHHHQCLLGLGTGKPALGELNYRMSRTLPLSPGDLSYGSVFQSRVEAQKLLSGLSAAQHRPGRQRFEEILWHSNAQSTVRYRVLQGTYRTDHRTNPALIGARRICRPGLDPQSCFGAQKPWRSLYQWAGIDGAPDA